MICSHTLSCSLTTEFNILNGYRDEGGWRRGPAEESSSWRDSARRDDRGRDDRRRERDDRRDLRERRDDRDRRGPPLRSEREEGMDGLHVAGLSEIHNFWGSFEFYLIISHTHVSIKNKIMSIQFKSIVFVIFVTL